MAVFNFPKRPSQKNFQRRSISFQESEVSIIKPEDAVAITIYSGRNTIHVNATGREFLAGLKTASKDGRRFKVFKF